MNKFAPDYQSDSPVEFGAIASWYMERYWNPAEPEAYATKMKYAVEYANKSLMLQQLGLDHSDDLEEQNPELFQRTFTHLAKSNPHLNVDGDTVTIAPDLVKSMDGSTTVNELYISLWKQTFDTVKTTGRM